MWLIALALGGLIMAWQYLAKPAWRNFIMISGGLTIPGASYAAHWWYRGLVSPEAGRNAVQRALDSLGGGRVIRVYSPISEWHIFGIDRGGLWTEFSTQQAVEVPRLLEAIEAELEKEIWIVWPAEEGIYLTETLKPLTYATYAIIGVIIFSFLIRAARGR